MEKDHPYYNELVSDPRYSDGPLKEEFPMYESLEMTVSRTLPYWNDVIVPQLREGKRILIAAHGNSLRGIVKHLDSEFSSYFPLLAGIINIFVYHFVYFFPDMSEEMITQLNLPTGIPFEYVLNEDLTPVVSLKFFGDEETVRKAMEAVAALGKAK